MINLRQFLKSFANEAITIGLLSKDLEEAQERVDELVNVSYNMLKKRLETIFTNFLGTVEVVEIDK